MPDRLFDFGPLLHRRANNPASEPKQDGVLYALYLAAIAGATIGWGYLIVQSLRWSIGL